MEDYNEIYRIEKARQVNQLEIYKVREDLFVKQNLLKTYLQEVKNKAERYNQIYLQIKEQKNNVSSQTLQKNTNTEVLINRLKEHKNLAVLAKSKVTTQEKAVAETIKEASQLKNREVLLTKMLDRQNVIKELKDEQIQNDEVLELSCFIKEKDKIDSREVESKPSIKSDNLQVDSSDPRKMESDYKLVDPALWDHARKNHSASQAEQVTQVMPTPAETLGKWQSALKNYITSHEYKHTIIDGKSVLEINEIKIGNNNFAITITEAGGQSVNINFSQINKAQLAVHLKEEGQVIVKALEMEGIKVKIITVAN